MREEKKEDNKEEEEEEEGRLAANEADGFIRFERLGLLLLFAVEEPGGILRNARVFGGDPLMDWTMICTIGQVRLDHLMIEVIFFFFLI